MKSKLLKRIIVLTVTVATLLTALPISASAAWKRDSKGWWNTEGNSYSVGWRQIDSKWCYFDKSGYMVHNTIVDGYYLDSKGIAVATTNGDIPIKIPCNWIQLDNKEAIAYVIDGKATLNYNTTDTSGCSEINIINAFKMGLTNGSCEAQVSEKNYNGKNATSIQCTLTTNSVTKESYTVIFFKNDKAYFFNIASSADDFDNEKQQLEDMLNLSLVL